MAALVPYAGRLGGGFGLLILIYVIAVLAAIAIPAYQDYVSRAYFAQVVAQSQSARESLATFYLRNERVPESLQEAGVPNYLPGGSELALDQDQMILTVTTPRGTVIFTPSETDDNRIEWSCGPGPDVRPSQLPPSCQDQPLPPGK